MIGEKQLDADLVRQYSAGTSRPPLHSPQRPPPNPTLSSVPLRSRLFRALDLPLLHTLPGVHSRAFDSHLGPYPVQTWPIWSSLVSAISDTVLHRCTPITGTVTSTALVLARLTPPPQSALPAAASGAEDERRSHDATAADAGQQQRQQLATAAEATVSSALAGSGSSSFFFSAIRGVGAGAKGRDVTAFAMDTSDALLYLIGKCVHCGEALACPWTHTPLCSRLRFVTGRSHRERVCLPVSGR